MPGSDSWQHKDSCITPIPAPPPVSQDNANCSGAETWPHRHVEAAGFTRMLLGQHLPRQSRGRRICLVPPTGHRAPSRLTVAPQRGTYRKVLWPRRHSCSPGTCCTSEQVVPVLRLVVQECQMCHCVRGLQKLPCCPWGSRRCLRSSFLNWVSRHPVVLPS